MKRQTIYILLLLLSAAPLVAHAQTIGGKIRISNLQVARHDTLVTVNFMAHIGRNAVSEDETLIVAPLLTDGNYAASLLPVIVQGGSVLRQIKRHEWVTGSRLNRSDAVYSRNNKRISYSASIPAQLWMDNATLMVETRSDAGNESLDNNRAVLISLIENVDLPPAETLTHNIAVTSVSREGEEVSETWEIPPTIAQLEDAADRAAEVEVIGVYSMTTEEYLASQLADTMRNESIAEMLPFVAPVSEMDPEAPTNFWDEDQESALVVYFAQNSFRIDPNYRNNAETLRTLNAVIKKINQDPDSKLKYIVVAGFSSPEGRFELNDRLAFDRAVSVKQYIIQNTGVSDKDILLYNGSVDWRGLRRLVEQSDLADRDAIVEIIDNTPVEKSGDTPGRLDQLKLLNNGETYRLLYDEYFPLLRGGSSIKLYYGN